MLPVRQGSLQQSTARNRLEPGAEDGLPAAPLGARARICDRLRTAGVNGARTRLFALRRVTYVGEVGIREFREKLASYLLKTEVPVAIKPTETIGYYIPARRKRSEAECTALKEAAVRLQQVLTAEGISEEEILNDFKNWRAGGRKCIGGGV
jgi:hypothetical protein